MEVTSARDVIDELEQGRVAWCYRRHEEARRPSGPVADVTISNR